MDIVTLLIDRLRAGQFAEISGMFPPNLQSLVPPEAIRAAWQAEIDRQGAVSAFGAPLSEPAGAAGTLVRVPVTFAGGAATVLATIAGDRVTSLQIAGPEAAQPTQEWQPPEYADPAALSEEDVLIGDGPLAVPGTLTLPAGPAIVAAVVLLAGSGPLDRDETIGRNKPFKDLAWGLATRGIATVRFDKVTFAKPAGVAKIAGFTVDDEYLHHALAAVDLLRHRPGVDPARIFVLGHSLGGSVAPRVAAADRAVAGLVILGGGAQPMHWSAVRQFRYLGSPQQLLDSVTRQAEAVDSPDLSPATPVADLPFGVPASYWLDLRGYDPAAAAAALGKPMLILQGGRDYQATVDDDLARWRAALGDHPGVTIRIHDADNHFFFAGSGPSKPAEYERAQHVDPAVVTDISHWIQEEPS
ncbi:alpha/beta hydrolase [Actinoplanes subtropicus]|uniref:alpha/beta hydrolase n=1 Tax=Actinoplanes subtropicus TaxID=543632 RepID=UPI0004C38F60|nr:alpha/beta hydrolase [Actinoplanes subtropicus]